MKKGFTLIEVILAIALIGIVGVYFIPAVTFGYSNLIKTEEYTKNYFDAQEIIEAQLQTYRDETLIGNDDFEVFDVKVKGHHIKKDIGDYRDINVFIPNFNTDMLYKTPKLIRNNHNKPTVVVLDVYDDLVKKANSIKMFNNNIVNTNIEFIADENNFKIDDRSLRLVNVYRWYISTITEEKPNYEMQDFFVIKEWNAARGELLYEDSKALSFIPNIKNDPSYNTFKFEEVQTGLGLEDNELINEFGNRYIFYSVTPYAISGKIGKEEISNPIYIEAPRIEIKEANYYKDIKEVNIHFNEGVKLKDELTIQDILNHIVINIDLGNLKSYFVENDNILKLSFENEEINNNLETNIMIEGNIFKKGIIESLKYGEIDIWVDGIPNSEFDIKIVE